MNDNHMPNIKLIVSAISIVLGISALSTAQTKPTLAKAKGASVRLAYKGKSALVDLDNTDNVTLGGERRHSYRLFFTAVKDGAVYFLFQEQGGSPMSNPMGPCCGDQPQTLIWLKTDLQLKVVGAKPEVFASCAFNGGRYQQGKTQISGPRLKILFEEHRQMYEINYNNQAPDKSFAVGPATR